MGPDFLRLERLLSLSVSSPGVPLLRHEDGMSDTRQASCCPSPPPLSHRGLPSVRGPTYLFMSSPR